MGVGDVGCVGALPKTWLKKIVVAVTKDTWKELQQK
jgi:hypothetical protein